MREKKITFVGKSFARPGFTFLYKGPNKLCPRNCRLYNTCMGNLTPNKIYRVNKILNKEMDCPFSMHEESMVLVEVIQPELEISMPSKNVFVGSISSYNSIACDKKDCKYYEICHPDKLLIMDGQKIKILDEIKKIKKCPLGYHLSIVSIEKREK